MSVFDRSKIKGASSEALEAQKETVNNFIFNNSAKVDFLKFKEGANIRRIFPPHPDCKTYIIQKGVHWLPIGVTIKEEGKEDRVEIKRLPVFNSRIHGNTAKDLVEEYIKYATKCVKEEAEGMDEKEANSFIDKKMKAINDWKTGILLQLNWVFYSNGVNPDGTKGFGKQEVTNGVKYQMDTLSLRAKNGKSLITDVFSDPDTGKAVQISYNPNDKDNKKKYVVTLLWEEDWTLTDQELEEWLKLPSLEELFLGAFKRTDFLKQLQGLENFDATHKLNYMAHDEFQEIIEEIASYFPEESAPEEEKSKSEGGEEEPEEVEFNNPLNDLSKSELKDIIEFAELDIKPRPTHSAERIATDIAEYIGEKDGIDGSDLEKALIHLREEAFADESEEEAEKEEEQKPEPEAEKEEKKPKEEKTTAPKTEKKSRLSGLASKYD